MTESLADLLAVATDAARSAGKHTLKYFNEKIDIVYKADESPVTRADTESEAIIRYDIQKYFPHHAILGEESGAFGASTAPIRWIIDPLDGTKSFVRGVPLYAVLVGVVVDGKPSVGACYLPATDQMIAAATGFGCTRNYRRVQVSTTATIEDATISTTNPARLGARWDGYLPLARRAKMAAGWGDAYGHVMVATGQADVMVDPRTSPWDLAALMPILAEAGGRLTSWRGEDRIDAGDAVSTNGVLHAAMIDALADAKPDRPDIR